MREQRQKPKVKKCALLKNLVQNADISSSYKMIEQTHFISYEKLQKNYANVFKNAIITSEKLNNLRKSKAAKAERRKAKKAQEMLSEQTDIPKDTEPFGDAFSSESNDAEEAMPQSEQAELSEQNTQSDSFVHASAEMPTDFSQKWDQVTSPEQTDPPAYTGSIWLLYHA